MARQKAGKGVTLIAPNTQVVGDVEFEDQLYIDGRVVGNVIGGDPQGATVIISEQGSVRGEIRAANVIINGAVAGSVYASVRLELAGTAKVQGNVYYQLIEMQLGATVDGQLLHYDPASAEIHEIRGADQYDDRQAAVGGA
jgi:cytoskeletal protein CcmA (bactofilin family)